MRSATGRARSGQTSSSTQHSRAHERISRDDARIRHQILSTEHKYLLIKFTVRLPIMSLFHGISSSPRPCGRPRELSFPNPLPTHSHSLSHSFSYSRETRPRPCVSNRRLFIKTSLLINYERYSSVDFTRSIYRLSPEYIAFTSERFIRSSCYSVRRTSKLKLNRS